MRLTVLVVAQNHGRYLRDTLGGVFSQKTSFEFDVIVSDSGSTDETRAIVDAFSASYPGRARIICGRDVGDAVGRAALLRALPECDGEYIATLCASDYWTDPEKLQRQVDFLDARPNLAMCFHACQVRYEDADDQWWEMRCGTASVTLKEMLAGAPVQLSTIVFRRSLVSELCRWPSLLSDWFIGVAASRAGGAGYIDTIMSGSRDGVPGSFAGLSRADQWAEVVRRYEGVTQYLGGAHEEIVERTICESAYIAATEYEKKGAFDCAEGFLLRARRSKPEWLETYAMCYGMTGSQLLHSVRFRRLLYAVPWLFSLWQRVSRALRDLRWLWTHFVVRLQSHVRLVWRQPVGSVAVLPNPVRGTAKNPECAQVYVQWRIAGSSVIEVRVGRPDGVLLSRSGPLGSTGTGGWVVDGTVFFVQDGDDAPLSLRHTIAVTRAAVTRWSRKQERAS